MLAGSCPGHCGTSSSIPASTHDSTAMSPGHQNVSSIAKGVLPLPGPRFSLQGCTPAPKATSLSVPSATGQPTAQPRPTFSPTPQPSKPGLCSQNTDSTLGLGGLGISTGAAGTEGVGLCPRGPRYLAHWACRLTPVLNTQGFLPPPLFPTPYEVQAVQGFQVPHLGSYPQPGN